MSGKILIAINSAAIAVQMSMFVVGYGNALLAAALAFSTVGLVMAFLKE